jgi:hypothetical protein
MNGESLDYVFFDEDLFDSLPFDIDNPLSYTSLNSPKFFDFEVNSNLNPNPRHALSHDIFGLPNFLDDQSRGGHGILLNSQNSKRSLDRFNHISSPTNKRMKLNESIYPPHHHSIPSLGFNSNFPSNDRSKVEEQNLKYLECLQDESLNKLLSTLANPQVPIALPYKLSSLKSLWNPYSFRNASLKPQVYSYPILNINSSHNQNRSPHGGLHGNYVSSANLSPILKTQMNGFSNAYVGTHRNLNCPSRWNPSYFQRREENASNGQDEDADTTQAKTLSNDSVNSKSLIDQTDHKKPHVIESNHVNTVGTISSTGNPDNDEDDYDDDGNNSFSSLANFISDDSYLHSTDKDFLAHNLLSTNLNPLTYNHMSFPHLATSMSNHPHYHDVGIHDTSRHPSFLAYRRNLNLPSLRPITKESFGFGISPLEGYGYFAKDGLSRDYLAYGMTPRESIGMGFLSRDALGYGLTPKEGRFGIVSGDEMGIGVTSNFGATPRDGRDAARLWSKESLRSNFTPQAGLVAERVNELRSESASAESSGLDMTQKTQLTYQNDLQSHTGEKVNQSGRSLRHRSYADSETVSKATVDDNSNVIPEKRLNDLERVTAFYKTMPSAVGADYGLDPHIEISQSSHAPILESCSPAGLYQLKSCDDPVLIPLRKERKDFEDVNLKLISDDMTEDNTQVPNIANDSVLIRPLNSRISPTDSLKKRNAYETNELTQAEIDLSPSSPIIKPVALKLDQVRHPHHFSSSSTVADTTIDKIIIHHQNLIRMSLANNLKSPFSEIDNVRGANAVETPKRKDRSLEVITGLLRHIRSNIFFDWY